MNDAENLTKLLGHLPPAVFREFLVDEFSLAMPNPDAKTPKKEQREQMETVLSALGFSERQRIEEVAERIVLLSDGAGQDVIDGSRTTSSMMPPGKPSPRSRTSTNARSGSIYMSPHCSRKH